MFQFRYQYTLEDMDALSKVSAKTYRRKKVLLYRSVLAIMGAAYLFMGYVLFTPGSKLAGAILLAAGILFAALAIFFHRGTAWRSRRMLMAGEETYTIKLEEEGVRGQSGMGESFYRYDSVIGTFYYRERYFLFLDKRHAILLPEQALTQGDPARLKSFLAERLGKEPRELS